MEVATDHRDRDLDAPGAGAARRTTRWPGWSLTMNASSNRLEAASAPRQRRFVGDASHELQSPLTTFRTQLEVALGAPGVDTDWSSTSRGGLLGDSAARWRASVRDLLFLATRGRGGRRTWVGSASVDLDDLVLEEAARVRTASLGRRMRHLGRSPPPPSAAAGQQLRRLVRNLLENAVRHADSDASSRR